MKRHLSRLHRRVRRTSTGRKLPVVFRSGWRVRLAEVKDEQTGQVEEPVQFGTVVETGPTNGVLEIILDRDGLERDDDGYREVPVEQVEAVIPKGRKR